MSSEKDKLWTDMESYLRSTGSPPESGGAASEAGSDPDGFSRRDFLRLGGVAAVFSMVGCMQRPAEKIIPYLNQPEELVPGVATWYASTCGCTLLTRLAIPNFCFVGRSSL